MKTIIAVDAGTSSLRSVLFDESGKILYMAQRAYQAIFPKDGYVEQVPMVWKDALYGTLSETRAFAEQAGASVQAISLTSQRSSVFAVDAHGQPLTNAIMWHDKRCLSICETLEIAQSSIYQKTGLRLDPMFSAPKMAWIRKNLPLVYRSAHKLLGVHEYLLHCLCGEFITDCSVASRSMLMNINEKIWDDQLLEWFGIDSDKLCEIRPQGSAVQLRAQAAEATGLPKGTTIICAGGDQQCGALGLGLVDEEQIEVTNGTGAYVVRVKNAPYFDKYMRTLCNVGAMPGTYIVEAPILTAGNVYRWFADTFIDQEGAHRMQELNSLVQQSPIGANGVMIFPCFQGSGCPDWNSNAKGSFHNISLNTTKADFARAILEGIALEVARNVQIIDRCSQELSDTLNASGGMCEFALYNQILADACNKRVVCRQNNQATAKGAWMVAAVALGVFENFSAASNSAEQQCEIYHPDSQKHLIYKQMLAERKKIKH